MKVNLLVGGRRGCGGTALYIVDVGENFIEWNSWHVGEIFGAAANFFIEWNPWRGGEFLYRNGVLGALLASHGLATVRRLLLQSRVNSKFILLVSVSFWVSLP